MSRCWSLLAVLSTLIALASTHRGRGGFGMGGFGGGSSSSSGGGGMGVCLSVYSAFCSSKYPARPAGMIPQRKNGNELLSLLFGCIDGCQTENLCLVNVTSARAPWRRRPAAAQLCPLCFSDCPSGTSCVEDREFCANNPEDVICKLSAMQTSYNVTLSRCLMSESQPMATPPPMG